MDLSHVMNQSFDPPSWSCPGQKQDINHFIVSSLCFLGTRQSECSLSLLRPTGRGISEGFAFDLSVVTFLRHLVIWTFDINYLCSSWPRCFHLEMLFEVCRGDLKKAVTADSTHKGLWFVQLICTQRQGLHSVFLPWCPGTSLAFALPCDGFKWLVHLCATFPICKYNFLLVISLGNRTSIRVLKRNNGIRIMDFFAVE